ncbi:hypothetical protein [Nonomuraea helvata]|uniref:Uncharacterized protein n=1 Tax=Nonomuraea helvata TaxID=37484 RepID=A0ABV5S7J6_9ACTN
MSLSRRQLFRAAGATTALSVAGQAVGMSSALAALPWARSDIGVSAYEFDLGQVRLTSGRWPDNQNRALDYLRFVDVDRPPNSLYARAPGLPHSRPPEPKRVLQGSAGRVHQQRRGTAATVRPPPGVMGHSEEKAASKAAAGGVMALSERM